MSFRDSFIGIFWFIVVVAVLYYFASGVSWSILAEKLGTAGTQSDVGACIKKNTFPKESGAALSPELIAKWKPFLDGPRPALNSPRFRYALEWQ